MRIGLIAIDMDGTLLNTEHTISEASAQALREATQAGIVVAICSGRMPEDINWYAQQAGLSCWVCGGNGCRVLDAPYGKLIEEHVIDPATARVCVELGLASGLEVFAFAGTRTYTSCLPEGTDEEQWIQRQKQHGCTDARVGAQPLRDAADAGEINKLMVIDRTGGAALAPVRERLNGLPEVELTSSWADNIEILPAGVNKGTAVAALAARFGIERERVMTIGDQENDRAMIEWAGWGIAMGNATPEIRAISRWITKDNAHEGVAVAVRRWALEEEGFMADSAEA